MYKDYYAILRVAPTASKGEVKRSYHTLAVELHPDKPTGDTDKFKELGEAYDVLGDPKKRKAYDEGRSQEVVTNLPAAVEHVVGEYLRELNPEPSSTTDHAHAN